MRTKAAGGQNRIRIALFAAVLPALLLGACGRRNETPVTPDVQQPQTAQEAAEETAPQQKGELTVGLPSDITGLNPMTSAGGVNDNCIRLTHETLFSLGENGTATPLIALAGEWTSDTTYELMIRTGITFTNDAPLTANDVAFTFGKARELLLTDLLGGIEEVTALTEDRVQFTVTERIDDIETVLANEAFSIQSEAAYATGMQNPYLIGSGPYAFADRVNGRYTTFVRNESYWGTEKGLMNRVSFMPYPTETDRAEAVRTGAVDVALSLSGDVLAPLREDENLRVGDMTDGTAVVSRKNVTFEDFQTSGTQNWAAVYALDY